MFTNDLLQLCENFLFVFHLPSNLTSLGVSTTAPDFSLYTHVRSQFPSALHCHRQDHAHLKPAFHANRHLLIRLHSEFLVDTSGPVSSGSFSIWNNSDNCDAKPLSVGSWKNSAPRGRSGGN